ncbi:P-loop containing nucleoside triphosphate hydrolase protein [Gloeopeniophorella convolvens]|nr:P-loop containing nucleoside triphosphate hydrolase protein [Gloeopeniophorella convolvens]
MPQFFLLPSAIAGASVAHIVMLVAFPKLSNRHIPAEPVDDRHGESRALGDARFGGKIGLALRTLRIIGIVMLLSYVLSGLPRAVGTPGLQVAFYVYAMCLAILSILSTKAITVVADAHLGIMLFANFVVHAYQDLYPIALVGGTLPDLSASLRPALSFVVGVVVPLALPRGPSPDPSKNASLWSLLTWSYLDHVIFYAARHVDLPLEEMPPLKPKDDAAHLVDKYFKDIDPTLMGKRRHLFWSLMVIFKLNFIEMTLLIVAQSFASFLAPVGIQQLLRYLERTDEPGNATFRPWVWIAWLALGPFISSFLMEWYKYKGTAVRLRAEALLTQLVFAHALRTRMTAEAPKSRSAPGSLLAPSETSTAVEDEDGETAPDGGPSTGSDAAARTTVAEEKEAATKSMIGKINNLITSDLSAIQNGTDFLHFLQLALQIVGSSIYLYLLVGWAAFVGTAVFLITIPIPARVGRFQIHSQTEKMKASDRRVQAVTQTMSVLRMIKLFAWENKSKEKLFKLRDDELYWVRRSKFLGLLDYAIGILPLFVVLTTYGTFVLVMRHDLTPSIVFTSVALFNILESQIFHLMGLVPSLIAAKVSLDRMGDWLYEAVLIRPDASTSVAASDDVIGFNACDFTWTRDSNIGERDFHLTISDRVTFERGCINLIVGPTGAGKTSVLSALLGEMHFHPHDAGSYVSLPRQGGIAYAAQEGWVLNDTIRANILFGAPMEEGRYKKVLEQCALVHDLSLFAASDLTEVGEKARVTLARAIYSSAQILLLDDVLAALDVHTSRFVVENALQGDLLRDRTVLLVTHNIALMHALAEKVVRVDSTGRVIEEESLEHAIQHDGTLLAELALDEDLVEKAEQMVDGEPIADEQDQKDKGKLTVAEEVAHGSVSWASIMLYLSNMGGVVFWTLRVITALGKSGFYLGRTFYLGYWSTQYDGRPASEVPAAMYLAGYAAIILSSVLFGATGDALWIGGAVRTSRKINQLLVTSVLGSTFRWLDTVPTARVITRCTQDLGSVDGRIPAIWGWGTSMGTNLILMFIGISYIVGWPAFVTGVFVSLMGMGVGRIYIVAQRAIKRQQSVAKSPVMSLVGVTLAGLPSVRAYGAENMFREQLISRSNMYIHLSHNGFDVNRWLDIRMEALGSIFAAVVASGVVYGGILNGAYAGFALSQVLFFTTELFWFVRTVNMAEVEFISLERIRDFLRIEHEPKPTPNSMPPAYWPSTGSLKVVGLCASYGPESPDVLHDISFDIKSGERVGVVGRTGAGKSTISLALLRGLLTRGEVYYDGIDIHKINLDALRANVTLIPQHPELLAGTLRENLDPFEEHDDATLIDALKCAGLFRLQKEDDKAAITLDSEVEGGGTNFSHGQRQIIALARAQVRGSKLMIMDEATAAIDYETDNVIQDGIRTALGSDVTIITIAHRLQTIMDSDRIMVLDAGRLVEFGSPKELLSQKKGFFYDLVEGSHDKEKLYAKVKR